MIVITESSEAGNRDIFHMIAQTDKPDQPSVTEIFEAQSHFMRRPTEGCTYSPRISDFQPYRTTLDKLAAPPAFSYGNTKFWISGSAA
jgi:hypothetical protein